MPSRTPCLPRCVADATAGLAPGHRLRTAFDDERRHPRHRFLPAAVPSDSGERRLVGCGIHRVAQRRPCQAEFCRTLPAPSAGRSRLLRSARARDARTAGGAGAGARHWRLLLLPLLVFRQRLLQRPFDEVLSSGEPDFPFCVCWANETWTRRWDGLDSDILIAQRYRDDDALALIRDLLPAFADRRYVRIDGKPLLLVYCADAIPDPPRWAAIWRGAAREAGYPDLYLALVQSVNQTTMDPSTIGYDAAVEFPPHLTRSQGIAPDPNGVRRGFQGDVLDYVSCAQNALARPRPDYRLFRGVMTGWDNTARVPDIARCFVNAEPANYERWLAAAAGADARMARRRRAHRLRQCLERVGRGLPSRAGPLLRQSVSRSDAPRAGRSVAAGVRYFVSAGQPDRAQQRAHDLAGGARFDRRAGLSAIRGHRRRRQRARSSGGSRADRSASAAPGEERRPPVATAGRQRRPRRGARRLDHVSRR